MLNILKKLLTGRSGSGCGTSCRCGDACSCKAGHPCHAGCNCSK